jgi:hypothetical protein
MDLFHGGRGPQIMLNEDDKAWLRQAYPRLSPASDEISGVVDFTGTYNGESDHFQVLYDDSEDEVGGLRLKGSFAIRLKPRTDTSLSKLPALYVLDVKPIDDRHFSRVDQSACLCSPFEEEEFLVGGLAFIVWTGILFPVPPVALGRICPWGCRSARSVRRDPRPIKSRGVLEQTQA